MRILTWHVHGSYLYYLVQAPHDFVVPFRPDRGEGYGGREAGGFAWPDNLREVPAEAVRELDFDCVIYQSQRNWQQDGPEILAEAHRRGPRIFLEHDPPREQPTDTRHLVDDPRVLLVHVTPFNELMWDAGRTPTRVVDHGVAIPEGVRWTGELERGLVIVNNLCRRGRRLGPDVFGRVRAQGIALDLVGMNAQDAGGIGEVDHAELAAFSARYRFLFNPIRYTSLGLAVCEAMMVGLPVVGLATTEMATAVQSGRSGWVDTDVGRLVEHMRRLLCDHDEALRLSAGAQRRARERFGLERFIADWEAALRQAVSLAET